MRHDGADWEVRDLGSTNGTYLDGQRLESGERRTVLLGSRLAFGHNEEVYELISDEAPGVAATCSDGTRRETRLGSLLLPSNRVPRCMVYSEGRHWYVDGPETAPRQVENGETILVGDKMWTLELPTVVERTAEAGRQWTLDALSLRFLVSRDEDHVDLELVSGTRTQRLPPSVCWDTLLVLARERVKDQERGFSERDAGWMDAEELEKRADLQVDALNRQVLRARIAFADAQVEGHARIIQRRRVRKIRLGVGRIEIVRS